MADGVDVDSEGNPIPPGSGTDLSWLLHPYGGHSTNYGPQPAGQTINSPPLVPAYGAPPAVPMRQPPQSPDQGGGGWFGGFGGAAATPMRGRMPTFPFGFGAQPAQPMRGPAPNFPVPDLSATQPPLSPNGLPIIAGPGANPLTSPSAAGPLPVPMPNSMVMPAQAATPGSPTPAVPPLRPTNLGASGRVQIPAAAVASVPPFQGSLWDPQGAGFAAAQRLMGQGSPWDPQGAGYTAAQRMAQMRAQVPGPMADQSNVTNFMGGPPITTGSPFGHYVPTSGNARGATWVPPDAPPPAPASYNLGYGGGRVAPQAPRAPVTRGRMTPVQPQGSQLFPRIGGLGEVTSFGDSPSPGGPAPLGPEALKHVQAGKDWWNSLWR